ncbi:Type II/IV secretion system protein, TadC subfamily [Sulfitobacter noctilucae]|uniref:type II secretion system F family protein n=1 Tax=Sulfitobacter noctilucae TaxID=1342302 RepID=UPI000469DD83|nr:type II secretion system F family protein [Sulfitobacter noctilucae]KIN60267.1 Type II/IV secretion system protein, TadC subfamily [Sulfitobacter noctilucae]
MQFLTNINDQITALLGPMGLIIIVGVLGLILVAMTVVMMLRQPEDPLEKLKRNSSRKVDADGKATLRQASGNQQLQKFAKFLEPEDVNELSAKQLELRQAGYQSRDAVRMFYFAQMALGLLGLLGGVIYVNFLGGGEGLSTQKTMMYTIGPGGVGYYLPKYWITKRVDARKEEITRGFPDALDMMLVCVEAGQSLDQCIVRVASELKASYRSLSEEFEVVAYEMKAGKDKITVLNDMGERCGVQDVSSFVTVLVQSAAFGTSISDALRVYAAEMRDKRVMRAEEAANKLPTKMTLATMMLTVPPLLIILVGPSVLGITELGKMGAGGN